MPDYLNVSVDIHVDDVIGDIPTMRLAQELATRKDRPEGTEDPNTLAWLAFESARGEVARGVPLAEPIRHLIEALTGRIIA